MGLIYLYTGEGAGKTTNALGLALRSIGHKQKVIIIQFLKWWKKTGEYKFKDILPEYYEIYQFGREGWIGLENLTEEDKELTRNGLEFARKCLEKKPNLLILDEINLAVHCKMIDVKEILEFLDQVPKETTVILTGRHASQELIDRADFVNEIIDKKHPDEIPAQEGIQY